MTERTVAAYAHSTSAHELHVTAQGATAFHGLDPHPLRSVSAGSCGLMRYSGNLRKRNPEARAVTGVEGHASPEHSSERHCIALAPIAMLRLHPASGKVANPASSAGWAKLSQKLHYSPSGMPQRGASPFPLCS